MDALKQQLESIRKAVPSLPGAKKEVCVHWYVTHHMHLNAPHRTVHPPSANLASHPARAAVAAVAVDVVAAEVEDVPPTAVRAHPLFTHARLTRPSSSSLCRRPSPAPCHSPHPASESYPFKCAAPCRSGTCAAAGGSAGGCRAPICCHW